jgi:hypothetical protein
VLFFSNNNNKLVNNKLDMNNFTEQDLDNLIKESILEANDMPYISQFATTEAGLEKIHFRIKQHILVRGISDIDTAIGLVESELSTPNIQE